MTEFGICCLSVVPVRAEPSERTEMVTQLLFGDLVVINSENDDWYHIRIVYDNYEGWIDKKMILPVDGEEFANLNNSPVQHTMDIVDIVKNISTGDLFPVLIGSSIRNISENHFFVGDKKYQFMGQLTQHDYTINYSVILENARSFLNAPYLWGGKTPFGVDCSGFTQQVFKISGVKLLRDASQQATQGELVNFISESEPGDLAFFDNDEGKIVHVGIVMDRQKIIHASGKVRIDTIDHQGIYNNDTKIYTHKLRLIKRII
jgi:cell wall-associated NlpC family hydrolase